MMPVENHSMTSESRQIEFDWQFWNSCLSSVFKYIYGDVIDHYGWRIFRLIYNTVLTEQEIGD